MNSPILAYWFNNASALASPTAHLIITKTIIRDTLWDNPSGAQNGNAFYIQSLIWALTGWLLDPDRTDQPELLQGISIYAEEILDALTPSPSR